MKKWIGLLLCTLFLFHLTACGLKGGLYFPEKTTAFQATETS